MTGVQLYIQTTYITYVWVFAEKLRPPENSKIWLKFGPKCERTVEHWLKKRRSQSQTFQCSSRRSTRSPRPGRTGHRSTCGERCCTGGTAPPLRTDPPRRPPTPPSHSPGWSEPGGSDGGGEAAARRREGRRMKQHGPGRAVGVPLRTPWRGRAKS